MVPPSAEAGEPPLSVLLVPLVATVVSPLLEAPLAPPPLVLVVDEPSPSLPLEAPLPVPLLPEGLLDAGVPLLPHATSNERTAST